MPQSFTLVNTPVSPPFFPMDNYSDPRGGLVYLVLCAFVLLRFCLQLEHVLVRA